MRELTPKQRKFVEIFDGNGTAAARGAGYKGSDDTLAQVAAENLRKPQIAAAIRARETSAIRPAVANREARQTFWTKVMHDTSEDTAVRLRASELLGKSEADFTDKLEVSGRLTLEQLVEASTKPPESK